MITRQRLSRIYCNEDARELYKSGKLTELYYGALVTRTFGRKM